MPTKTGPSCQHQWTCVFNKGEKGCHFTHDSLNALPSRNAVQGFFFGSDEDEAVMDGDNFVREEIILNRRRELVTKVCQSLDLTVPNNSDSRRRFLISEPEKLAMCYVPKTGCTFWKRVFLKLQSRDNPGSLQADVFKMNKLYVHYSSSIDTLMKFNNSFNQEYEFLSQATRVMFVREPYSRIFSGYVDKFILPDFWLSIGKKIVRGQRANPDPLSLMCGHDISFEEYLRRVVVMAKPDLPYYGDEHWFPIFKLCHPCTFHYDIIGRQETFAVDRDYIASKVGITDVLPSKLSREIRSIDAMDESILMVWRLKNTYPKLCSNVSLMVDRLWSTFQIQGYIPSNVPFPYPVTTETNMEDIQTIASKVYRQHKPSVGEWLERRRQAMLSAYKLISSDLLDDIREAFKYDFLLFGYDPKPFDIYDGR